MDVLRKTHEALVPGGWLLDIHPVPPPARVEVGGEVLGRLRTLKEAESFFTTVSHAEAKLDQLASSGLFVSEGELRREIVEQYESAEELFEKREGTRRVLAQTRRKLRSASGPVDVIETFVFRLLRTGPRLVAPLTCDALNRPWSL